MTRHDESVPGRVVRQIDDGQFERDRGGGARSGQLDGDRHGSARAGTRTGPVPFELAIVDLADDPTGDGFIVSGHDVTDRVRLEEELSYLAFPDSLTGLGNRALFQNRLAHAL